MTDTIADLERRLVIAKKVEKERLATSCSTCGGVGWFDVTTFNQAGAWRECNACHGTGWPAVKVANAVWKAFDQYAKPKPQGEQP